MLHTCVLALAIAAAPPAIDGLWEGELEDAPRPYVLALDFDRKVARLDATRDTEYPLEGLEVREDGTVRFSLQLPETLGFELRRAGTALRGQATAAGDPPIRVWAERLPVLAPPKDRVEAWRQDIDAFTHRFLRYDRSYSRRDAATARARLAKLRGAVSRLTDAQVTAELARIAALSDNAHTRLYLVRNRVELRRLPIRVWWFGDALHVVSAREEQQALLGCRVIRVGSLPVDAAARRVAPLYAGTPSWKRYLAAYTLTTPELLAGTGVSTDAEKVPFTLRCGDRTVKTVLTPLPLEKSARPVEAWWDLSPLRLREGWRHVLAATPERLPLALRHPDRHYWHDRVDEGRTLYVQYTRSQAQPERPFETFAREVLTVAKDPATTRIIVDLRFNTGGDLGVADPLFTELKAMTKPRLIVLTGRTTFSAAISHLARLRENAASRHLGEPVADDGDFWAEGGNVPLPNSGYHAHYANARHCYAPGARSWKGCFATFEPVSLTPHRVIDWTFDAYLRGEDPVMTAALRE